MKHGGHFWSGPHPVGTEVTGLEPAISGLTGRRDNHLRYTSLLIVVNKYIYEERALFVKPLDS